MADTKRIIEIIAKFRDDVTDPLNDLGKKIESLDGTIQTLSTRLSEVNDNLAKMVEGSGLASKATETLTQTQEKLTQKTKASADATQKLTQSQKESSEASQKVTTALDEQTKHTETVKRVTTELVGAQEQAANASRVWADRSLEVADVLETLQKSLQQTEKDYQTLSKSVASDSSWDRRTRNIEHMKHTLTELQGLMASLRLDGLDKMEIMGDDGPKEVPTEEFKALEELARRTQESIFSMRGEFARFKRELLDLAPATKEISNLREELDKFSTKLVDAKRDRKLGSIEVLEQQIQQIKVRLTRLGDEGVELRAKFRIDEHTEEEVRSAHARLIRSARQAFRASTLAETEEALSKVLREGRILQDLKGLDIDKTVGDALVEIYEKGAVSAETFNKAVQKVTTTIEDQTSKVEGNNKEWSNLQRVFAEVGRAVELVNKQGVGLTHEFSEFEKTISRMPRPLREMRDEAKKTEKELNFIERALLRVRHAGFNAGGGFRNLASEARNFVIAFAIKYAQSIITSLTALAAELVAVAASAVQAGAALGGALTSGMAQAIPVALLLTGVMVRLGSVLKTLNLHNQQAVKDGANREANDRKQATASDQLASAQDRVTDAQRGVAEAQRGLTEARKDARQELEDLIITEQRAQLAAEDGVLSQEEAQRRFREALRSGNSTDIDQARLNLRSANLDQNSNVADAARSATEAARGRRLGPEGSDTVRQARERLTDANRSLAGAQRDLSRAQLAGASAAIKETAAQTQLKAMIDQLTPAEQELYRSLIKLQETYRKNFRPITDIVINAFTGGVKTATGLLNDPQILSSFTSLAEEISVSMQRVFDRPDTKSFLTDFSELAQENLPAITDAFNNLISIFHNIAIAGAPLFKFIVDGFREFTDDFERVTGRTDHMKSFFAEAKEHLEGWADAIQGVWEIFTALIEASSGSGLKTLKDFADFLHKSAEGIRDNMGEAKEFFEASRRVLYLLAGIVGDLAVAIFELFNERSVEAFAEFIRGALIPALRDALEIVGQFVQVFHQIFGAPIIVDIIRFLATLFLLQKSFGILGSAIEAIITSFNRFWGLLIARKIGPIFIVAIAAVYKFRDALESVGFGIDDLRVAMSTFIGIFIAGKFAASLGFFAHLADKIKDVRKVLVGGTGLIGGLRLLAGALGPAGLAGVALLAVGGLLGFKSANNEAKISSEQATDALRDQIDAMRQLRDFDLEKKNRELGVEQAQLRAEETRSRLRELQTDKRTQDTDGDGKISRKEELAHQRALRQAKIDVRQADLDLIRSKRLLNDTSEDENRIVDEAKKKNESGLKTTRERLREVTKEGDTLDDLRKKVGKLRDDRERLIEIEGKRGATVERMDARIVEAEEKVRKKQEDIRKAQKDYAKSIRASGKAWLDHGGNAEQFGLTLDEVMQFVQDATNEGLSKFGAKKLKFNKRFRKLQKMSHFESDSHFGTDGTESGAVYAQGGWIPGSGVNDTVPIMAAPGEAIINRHQAPVVDQALRAMGIDGLQGLFRKINRPHYMAKGGVVDWNGHPALTGGIKRLLDLLIGKFPGLAITSTTDHSRLTSSGNVSDHVLGHAVDVGGTAGEMKDASSYIIRSGLYHQLKQGIHNPNLAVNAGKIVGSSYFGASTWAQHANHIHLAMAGRLAKVFRAILPKMKFDVEGAPAYEGLGQGMYDTIRKAGNAFLRKAEESSLDTNADAAIPSFEGDWTKYMANIAKTRGWSLADWKWIIGHESGGRVDAKNPNSTAFGLGQLLDMNYRVYGGGPGSSGSEQIAAMAKYIADRYGDPTRARDFWEKNGHYARGGEVPIIAHRGEMVLTKAQQARLGGSDFLARLFGFGGGGKTHFDEGGVVGERPKLLSTENQPTTVLEKALQEITVTFKTIKEIAADWRRKMIRDHAQAVRGEGARLNDTKRFARDMRDDFPRGAARGGTGLNLVLEDVAEALKTMASAKGKDLAKKFRKGSTALLEDNGLLDALGTALSTFASRKSAALIRSTFKLSNTFGLSAEGGERSFPLVRKVLAPGQVAKRELGNLFDERSFIGGEIDTVNKGIQAAQEQIKKAKAAKDSKALQNAQADLRLFRKRRGDLRDALAENIADIYAKQQEILELQVSKASDKTANVSRKADLTRRLATLKERAGDITGAFADRGGALASEGKALVDEKATLENLRKAALASGNTELARSLQEKIEDLSVSIEENTVAQADNTVELQKATLNAIISKSDFITGSLNSASALLDKFPGMSSVSKTIQQTIGTTLKSTLDQVIDQLGADFGGLGINTEQLKNMSLPDLVSTIANLVTQHPELADNELWKQLIGSLLNVSSAIKDNTDILNKVAIQNWSSTMWQEFRQAIFDGNGSLLPKYANVTTGLNPTSASTSTILPRMSSPVSNISRSDITVNMPVTKEADPLHIAHAIDFVRKTSR